MLGAALNAIRSLSRSPKLPESFVARAVHLLARNAVTRLIECSPKPSQVATGRAPIANVVMPLWGRVGSSFAMEGQIRYLLERGYFVNQVFLLDKPVEALEAFEYCWKMLRENSRYTRGSVQRVAFVDLPRAEEGRRAKRYLTSGAFNQLLTRIARNQTEDPSFDAGLKRAEITVVNHVFHSRWALEHTSGKRILETHDIQSYQMVKWPLINEGTQQPDSIGAMLSSEMDTVASYDHVINVAPDEHAVLSRANSNSTLITPYLPKMTYEGRYDSVREMGRALGWHESYGGVHTFDLLLAGDSHPANRESATWFIDEIFKPKLAPRGISLAIAGRLSDALHEQIGQTPQVYYVGFVDDLDSVKALSRLAILPDRRGTGISIKTLEVFATGMPFIGTSVAFRGLRNRLPAECKPYDQPDEMSEEIVRALSNAGYRNRLTDLASRCYAAVAGKEQFTSAWDNVFEAVLGRAPPRAPAASTTSGVSASAGHSRNRDEAPANHATAKDVTPSLGEDAAALVSGPRRHG